MNQLKRIWTSLLAASAFSLVLGTSTDAWATSGIMRVGIKVLEEDHYGTIIIGGDGYLDCAGHSIFNSTQDAVCYDDEEYLQCGVFVEGTPFDGAVDVKNCHIEGFTQGISVAFTSADVWIYDNVVIDNGQGVRATYSYDVFAFSNDVSSNTDVGLRIFESVVEFENSDFYYNLIDGVDGDGAFGALIESNIFRENGDHGLEFDGSEYVTIRNNDIDGYRSGGVNIDTDRDGIQVETTNHFTVEGNRVRDSGRHGIYLRNSLNGVVRSNNVASSGRVDSTGRDCRRNGGSATTFTSNTFGNHTGCTTVN